MKGRLLFTGARCAAENMAIDEALMESCRAESIPILRFYSWRPAAVSIGYFQGLEEEVDTHACRKKGVDIVRRITGGGAVFHHKEITYSIILPENRVPQNILESYAVLCGALVDCFKKLGLDARFVPINDIIVAGKKISGNAQTRRGGVLLQHGTILQDVDVDQMFELLKVPQEKMKGKIISEIKQRVTSLRHLGIYDEGKLIDLLKEGFEHAVQIPFEKSELSAQETEKAKELMISKFSSDHWISLR